MALGNLQWDQEGLFDEKTQLQKSHASVPLTHDPAVTVTAAANVTAC